MKRSYFVLILVLIALLAGASSFFVARVSICGSDGIFCRTNQFKAEAAKFADLFENSNASRETILAEAQKVFALRQQNILTACRHTLKTGSDRKAILTLLPTADSNQLDSCCIGPDCCCKFDSAQSKQLCTADPNFLTASAKLRSEMNLAGIYLASMLDDQSASESKIISAVENYMNKNTALELRSIEYFLAIRPHLTPDQQKQIFCSCTSQLRD